MACNVAAMPDERQITRLTPLIEGAASVAGEDDLGRLLRTLVTEAKTATEARYAALGVLGDHSVLSEFVYTGMSTDQARAIGHPPIGKGVLGTFIHDRETLILESIGEHPDSVGFPEHHPPMSTFLGVPISVGEEAFGNLYLTEKDGGFTEDDAIVVEALAHIAGAAIQTSRLQRRLRQVAIVEDRHRIARDLHDSVIQDLFAVGLGLQALGSKLEDASIADELNRAVDTLDESVATLRRYIFELRDTLTPALDLDARLQEVVARMGSAYPTSVSLRIDEAPGGPWDDDVVLLMTEALSNALRHSHASYVEVLVSVERSHLVVTVVDDGEGFDVNRTSVGMGLASMKARAESRGGALRITTGTDGGTRVLFEIPLTTSTQPS